MNPVQKLKTISVLPSLTPLETLRLLAGNVPNLIRGQNTDLARVTLFLSGASFSGYVSGIRDDGEASYILFVEHDDARSQTINIISIPVWAIMAVKVHEADQYLNLLSGGKVDVQKTTMGISSLRHKIDEEVSLLRTIVQADIKLEVSWETLTQDELTVLGLYELIDHFMHAVQEIVANEFMRIAFKKQVTAIRFQNAAKPEVCREGSLLIVRANLKGRASGRNTREEFIGALEPMLV